MRCDFCEYNQARYSYHEEDDACSLCPITSSNEQTENEYGIGCIYNKRTLDKRYKMCLKEMDDYFEHGGMP